MVGGLGVSGDTSCTDHIIGWKVRDALDLDSVPGGVSTTGDDNLIIADPVTPNSFQHPKCVRIRRSRSKRLPTALRSPPKLKPGDG